MSTQEQRERFYAFAEFAKRRVTMDGYPTFTAQDAWNAAWVAAEAAAIERCINAVCKQDEACTGASMQVKCLRALRALLPKEE